MNGKLHVGKELIHRWLSDMQLSKVRIEINFWSW